jgi:uncharacterized protein (UPF0335 family)
VIGHNQIAGEDLRSYVERIESLTEEKAALQGDITEIFSEAKVNGFDPKIMREVIKLRKLTRGEREEREAMITLYGDAIDNEVLGAAGEIEEGE